MNGLEELHRMRRILVAFDSMVSGTDLLDAAVEFARLVEAEVDALFVEDVELTRLAELPFVHELSLPAGTLRPLDVAAIERNWRALAANVRQALELRAQKSDVRCSFRVVRGRMDVELCAAAETADLVILSRAGGLVARQTSLHAWMGWAAAAPTRPVLLLPPHLAEIDSILLLYDGTGTAKSALAIAAQLGSRLRAAGRSPQVTVLCLGKTKAAAKRAETAARDTMSKAELSATFHPVVGGAELSAAVRAPANTLLVLPASLLGPGSEELERLAADWQNPILLVR